MSHEPMPEEIDPSDAYATMHFRINSMKMTTEFGAKFNTRPALKKKFGEDAEPTNWPGKTLTDFERQERDKEKKEFDKGVENNAHMVISKYNCHFFMCTNFYFFMYCTTTKYSGFANSEPKKYLTNGMLPSKFVYFIIPIWGWHAVLRRTFIRRWVTVNAGIYFNQLISKTHIKRSTKL